MNKNTETPIEKLSNHDATYRRKEELRRILGGQCARCGAQHYLQFDCVTSPGGAHHELNSRQRLAFYESQALAGNLQLLCPPCHTLKTLDEIAARRFSEARVACPRCNAQFRVADQLRRRPFVPHDPVTYQSPLPVAQEEDDSSDSNSAPSL